MMAGLEGTFQDKEFYQSIDYDERELGSIESWVQPFYKAWIDDFLEYASKKKEVRVLELGAGTCFLAAKISRYQSVTEIVATDVSLVRMERHAPQAFARCGGDRSKLKLQELNFNIEFPFPDRHFDLVMMDGALHHSRSLWLTLAECGRVLREDGLLVAQRETFLAPVTASLIMRRLQHSDEVRAGVSENAYLRCQYEYYLRAAGFGVRFKPVYPTVLHRALAPLNGIVFAKYVMWCSRDDTPQASRLHPSET